MSGNLAGPVPSKRFLPLRCHMSRLALALLPLVLAVGPRALQSQEHYTLGPINRVILVDIKPGKARDFWTDLRQNLRPLYDEYKRQGLIQNY
jgi:hypothetical protein